MKITIPKPCHENWSEMTPDDKGNFCNLCSTSVIDFSKKSEVEVVDFISSSTEKNICGNFNTNQLNINLDFSFLNSFLAKFTVGLMLTSGGWVSINAQQCDSINPKEKSVGITKHSPFFGKVKVEEKEQFQIDDYIKHLKDSLSSERPKTLGRYHVIKLFYIKNEQIITEADFKNLDTNTIKAIKVLKEKEAIKQYGEKARDGAIIIRTK